LAIEEIGSPYQLSIKDLETGVPSEIFLGTTRCRYQDGVFVSQDSGQYAHEISLNIFERTMHANIGGDFARIEESFIYSLVRDAFRKLILPFSGLVPLHGAAVTKGQKVYFFGGPSGAGKSTLAISLLEHGYAILADDAPLFMLDQGRALALSSLDELSITENTLDLYPWLAGVVSRRREVSGKLLLSRAKMKAEHLAFGPVEVTHFVNLKRGPCDRPQVIEVDKQLLLQELVRESMLIFRGSKMTKFPPEFARVSALMFDVMSQMVANAKTYELVFSNDHLSALPDVLENL
jgi:hypothetical protein